MSSTSPLSPSADCLIHARWVLPMNHPGRCLEHHSLALAGSRIVAIGPTAEIQARYPQPRQQLHLDSHVVLPGLINAHTHSPMNLLRGFADDLPLQAWLERAIWPAENRIMGEAYAAEGTRLAIAEMLLGGVTCFTDMYFFAEDSARVADECGIRAHFASPVFDSATAWGANADDYLDKATRLHDRYRHHERISALFGPHAPYTVSDAPLRRIAMLAEELDVGIHIHLHENAGEITQAMASHGLRPLQRLRQLDLLSPRLQAVHMTQLAPADLPLLAEHRVNVVHCPASNMKLASGICPVPALLEHGVNVALGTDGSASNNNLDMFEEMKLACLLAKTATGDAAALNAWQALAMATRNGAAMLGLEQELGTLETGKRADIIAVNLDAPNTLPVYDPASTLVYSADPSQVSHVWVDGQLLVQERRLTRMNLDDCLENARRWGQDIIRLTTQELAS
ncbi:MAG TPA: TRZ/ATZ family hydrolase [Hyphomicrobiales bacterium]|nr:TRZ/ATZ family hydrolase [Hyphomicrobiales bacterium]